MIAVTRGLGDLYRRTDEKVLQEAWGVLILTRPLPGELEKMLRRTRQTDLFFERRSEQETQH